MTPFSRAGDGNIERQLTEENPGFVNLVTMVETVWVLDRVYGLSNHEVAKAVERILHDAAPRVAWPGPTPPWRESDHTRFAARTWKSFTPAGPTQIGKLSENSGVVNDAESVELFHIRGV